MDKINQVLNIDNKINKNDEFLDHSFISHSSNKKLFSSNSSKKLPQVLIE